MYSSEIWFWKENTRLKITHREHFNHNYGTKITTSWYTIKTLFWKCNHTLKLHHCSLNSTIFSSHSNPSRSSCVVHVNFNSHIIFSSVKNNLLSGFISLTHAIQLWFHVNVYNSLICADYLTLHFLPVWFLQVNGIKEILAF